MVFYLLFWGGKGFSLEEKFGFGDGAGMPFFSLLNKRFGGGGGFLNNGWNTVYFDCWKIVGGGGTRKIFIY